MAEVARIQYDRMIMEKKKQKEISDVENQAHEARVKSQADADSYLVLKQADSNKVTYIMFIPGYAITILHVVLEPLVMIKKLYVCRF